MPSNKEERYRRDINWGPDGLQRLDRLAQWEKRSGADIARNALFGYEVAQSYFRDTIRHAVLELFRTLVVQEDGGYGDPDLEEASPADEAMSYLGSLLNSIYAAQGIREAFEIALDQNRMTRLEVPPAHSSAAQQHDIEQR